MKRSFPSPARQTLCALVGAVAFGAACTPNQNVKPGAPELIEFTIVQAGPTATRITSTTPECISGIGTGASCLPMGLIADAVDGGAFDAALPSDTICRQAPAPDMNWCTCVPDAPEARTGTWNCEPFTNVKAVIAVFDRLLDTAPLDPGDAAGLMDVVTTTDTSGAPPTDMLADYSSTGSPSGLVFNVFGPKYFGNFRSDGPNLFAAPQPEFPSGATVTVTLDPTKVRAKDGTTPFKGNGLLQGGTLVFSMAPFAASISPSVAVPDDPTAPPIPAMVTFTNFTDPTGHITATSNGAPVMIDVQTSDGATFVVTPKSGAWTTGATIVVTVDATVANLRGQTIVAPVTGTFTAP